MTTSAFIPHDRPKTTIADAISNPDPFYPDCRLAEFREKMRVDDTASDARVKEQILTALHFINAELRAGLFREQWHPSAANLPEPDVFWYQAAVYHRAKAYIIEQYRDIDTSKTRGDARADDMENRIDVYLQRSREALRRLLHRSRATIKLI